MPPAMPPAASPLPSLDALLRTPEAGLLIARFGRPATTAALRAELAARRAARAFPASPAAIFDAAADALLRRFSASQRPVFNLTGTVLHTNLGRAPLPPEAAQAAAAALQGATNLEYRSGLPAAAASATNTWSACCARLTGAEAATVVNNNAAAVHAGAEHPGARPRGAGLAWRADRDRRLLPHPRHHGPRRRRSCARSAPPTAPTRATTRRRSAGRPPLLMRVHQANYAISGLHRRRDRRTAGRASPTRPACR